MHKIILWINVTAEIHTSADVRNPPSITELSMHMIGRVVHPIRNKHHRLLVHSEGYNVLVANAFLQYNVKLCTISVVSGWESASVITMDLLKVATSLLLQLLPRYTCVLMYKYNYTKMRMTAWCD